MTFDVAIIGLGAHGSAIAAHGVATGLTVCGIDAGHPPHAAGSHHGESRIIRQAYYEDEAYVPLLLRAYALWDALQAETAEPLFFRTGGLMAGPSDGELVSGALLAARTHGLAHEALSAHDMARRFPAFRLAPGMGAVFEPQAGVLRPEACVRAHLQKAAGGGAVLRLGCQAALGDRSDGHVELMLTASDGGTSVVRARRVVVSAGAGLAALGLPASRAVQVERQVVAHFGARDPADAPMLAGLPIFAFEESDGRFHYGFPDIGSGVKVARHHGGAVTTPPHDISTAIDASDIDPLRAFLAMRLPAANGALHAAAACRYTNTSDQHFLIDDSDPRVLVVSACSGHGFKFAPVIGEVVARCVHDEEPGFDLRIFAPR
jgi:sarcosine oxidase